jgi:hypothetical protein
MRVRRDLSGEWMWDECELPCAITDLPPNEVLSPWMRRWIGRDPEEIVRTLATEWAGIRDPGVARFRDVVLTFRPFALARDDQRCYLGLKRPSEDGETLDGTLFLESPLEPAVLEKCLAGQHLEGHESIRISRVSGRDRRGLSLISILAAIPRRAIAAICDHAGDRVGSDGAAGPPALHVSATRRRGGTVGLTTEVGGSARPNHRLTSGGHGSRPARRGGDLREVPRTTCRSGLTQPLSISEARVRTQARSWCDPTMPRR